MSYLDDFERHDGEWLVHAPCGWVVSLDRVPVVLCDDAGRLLCPECALRRDETAARADWFQREKQPGDPFAALRWCDSPGVHDRLDAIVARERAAERARHRRDGGRARSTVSKVELASVLRANVACGNSDGTNIWPGTREVSRRSGVERKNAMRWQQLLEADGLLIDTGERRGRGGTPVLRAALSEIPSWPGPNRETSELIESPSGDEDEEVVDAEVVAAHEVGPVQREDAHAETPELVPSHEVGSVHDDELIPPDAELVPPDAELVPSHEVGPDLALTSKDLAVGVGTDAARARTRASAETRMCERKEHDGEREDQDGESHANDGTPLPLSEREEDEDGSERRAGTAVTGEDHDEEERTRRALADRWKAQRPDDARVELEGHRLAGASMLLDALGPAEASAFIDREARTAKPSTTLIHLAMREANRKPDRAA